MQEEVQVFETDDETYLRIIPLHIPHIIVSEDSTFNVILT